MAVSFATNNPSILLKMGVPEYTVAKLKGYDIQMVMGLDTITFKYKNSKNESVSVVVKFVIPTHVLLKTYDASNWEHKLASGKLTAAVENFLQQVEKLMGGSSASVYSAHSSVVPPDDPTMASNAPVGVLSAAAVSAGVVESLPVALHDAKHLYQRVFGTSPNSVYVVVAIAEKVKIAARAPNPATVSIRVEGDLTPEIVALFESLSFKKSDNGKYMSAHYTCNTNATPDRVLGAVLLATGLEFKTLMPTMKRVRELCS